MARDPKKLRQAYEYKLGKDLVKNLSDTQISELSKYYNSLTPAQQSEVDSETVMGKGEFLNTARSMADPLKYPSNQSVLPVQKNKNEDLSKVDETESKKTTPKKTKKKIDPLDELLKDIRSEKEDTTSSSKLAKRIIEKSQPIQKTKAQKFEADPEAAKVLGIDPFDLTEDEYKTLLKERMIKDRMGQKTDSGVSKIISNEFKRVKKGTPIQKSDKVYKSTITPQKLLPGTKVSKVKDKKQDTEEVSESVDNMNETLEGIDSVLKDILGQDKKEDEREKREAEKAQQSSEEKKSEEDSKKKVTKSLSNFKAPKIPFLDRVKDFFKNILIGGAVLKLIKWIQDPKNQQTIDNITNFITNNLDKILLGIAAIVGIGIGGKILGFLGLLSPLIGGLVGLLKGLLGGIVALLAKIGGAAIAGLASPVGLGILAIGGTLLAMKGAYDLTRNYITGGADFTAAHDILDQKLIDAGMTVKGEVLTGNQQQRRAGRGKGTRNPEQEKLFQEVQKERKKLKKLKEDRDKRKDEIEKQKKKDKEALLSDERYYSERKQNLRGGGSKTVRSLNEDGRKKRDELEKKAKEDKLRENLLARMATVDFRNEPLAQKMEELGLNESQKQYARWLSLTYGEKGVSEDMMKDTNNIQKFEKDSGISLSSTPPTISEPQTPLIPEDKSSDGKTPTPAELTESNEGTGNVPSTPPTQDNMTFELDVDSTRFALPEKTKPIDPPKPGTPDLSFLPLSMRKKNQALTSGSQAGQKTLTGFSSEDSNNLSIASVRSVYNSIA